MSDHSRAAYRVLVDKTGGLQSASLLLLTSSPNKIKVLPDFGTIKNWLLAGERRFIREVTLDSGGDVRFRPEADISVFVTHLGYDFAIVAFGRG